MSQASELERLMLDLINDERAAVGLDPVTLELRLNDSSEDHSSWMLTEDVFSHTGVNDSSAGDRMEDANFTFSGSWTWGENIAWQSLRGAEGFEDDVADLHEALMNSSGHRANILNANFEVIGIGIEIGDYNGWEAMMVTQNFARTGAAVQLDTGEPINAAPVASLSSVVFNGVETKTLATQVKYSDADGDAAVRFELRGGTEGFEVEIDGNTVDLADGFEFNAALMASLKATSDGSGSDATLELRAYDGSDWGAWSQFALRAPDVDQTSIEDLNLDYEFYGFVAVDPELFNV